MKISNGVNPSHYSQITTNLLKVLPEKQKDVLSRRFGLKGGEGETLEYIGKTYGVTRERIRQIENDGFLRLKSAARKYQKVFQYFSRYLKDNGGLKKEELILEDLGGKNQKNHIYFLLTLGKGFERFGETSDFYPLWTLSQNYLAKAKKTINSVYLKLKRAGKPLKLKNSKALISYLEVSKKIQKNSEGFYGLKEWPEINPRGVKDKAYLVFKKEQKPLHFKEVAGLIKDALPQTVHNELIKDSRFILVGRGIYALREWGYEEGAVKDIILKILKESPKPLTKDEILKRTLEQRFVKENTVLLNLSNRNYFQKTNEGRYKVREA